MACERVPVLGAIACTRGGRRARCSVAPCRRSHTRLCDFPMIGGGTCDAKLCDLHAHRQDGDRDYCPYHQRKRAGEGRDATHG